VPPVPTPPVQDAPLAPTPRPPAAVHDSAPPEIRLGEDGDPGTGLVSGSQVIPAGPDATFHNIPPTYPRDAARRGETGTVVLIIRIAPDGSASDVAVAQSSGYESLDRAARDAVLRWHFRPAQQDGIPVASVLPFRIVFSGDR
jgi:protein TonB